LYIFLTTKGTFISDDNNNNNNNNILTLKEHEPHWKLYLWFLLLWLNFALFPLKWGDSMADILTEQLKKCPAVQEKISVVTFWNVILCHGVSSPKTSNDSHHFENFKWCKMYPAFLRLEDLSLSLTWHSYICPKLAQTIFLIFILILSSTYTCLPCSTYRLTSFAKTLYLVTCSA
jgi:hypothetical protein